jgi:hypothetical protein
MDQMSLTTIYLLNTSIKNLYDEQIIGVRLFISLSKLEINTFYEFVQMVNDSLEYKNHHLRETLHKTLGGKSRMEIRELFDQAGIEYPSKWLGV